MSTTEIIHDDRLLELITDLLGSGREASFTYSGRSMHPVIHNGNRITVAPVNADDLLPGQIALYLPMLPDGTRGMVLHRYLGRNLDNTLRMRADACQVPDPPVKAEDVVGRIIQVSKARLVLRADKLPGSLLLGGSTTLPWLLSGLSCLREKLFGHENLPLIAIPRGRLLRERMLMQIAAGKEEPLLNLEENNTHPRLDPSESSLLPLLITRGQEAMVEIKHLLEASSRLPTGRSYDVSKAESALQWLSRLLAQKEQRLLLAGPMAIAWEYYPDPSCRPAEHITCIPLPGEHATIIELMLSAGAALAEPRRHLSGSLKHDHEITLRLPAPDWPLLYLNWGGSSTPIYNRRQDIARYWKNTGASIFSEHLRLMKVEAAIVFTFLRLPGLLPRPDLIWATDLLFLAKQKPDWEMINLWLEERRLCLPGAVAANWMHLLTPGTIPEEFVQSITDQASCRASLIERGVLRKPDSLLARLCF